MNKLEIFNEICTLALCYTLFIFTDFVDDPYIKWYFGYIMIVICSFKIVVNTLLMMYDTVKYKLIPFVKKMNSIIMKRLRETKKKTIEF
jgi:hypothetical protein